MFLPVLRKKTCKKRLTDGTDLLAHTVLYLPNGKGEAEVQDAAVGKHPSSLDVLLTSQAAAVLVVTSSIRHRRSLPVSSPACAICGSEATETAALIRQMQNPCRALLSSLRLSAHNSCLGSPSQVPDDSDLPAPRDCQEKGLWLVFTSRQENIPALCFTQPIPTQGKERKL